MQATDWQHPFVDVFKKYTSFQANNSIKGSVVVEQDPTIGRKVFKLTGSILSNNTVTIPDPTGQFKHTSLTGRYVYIELLANPEKYFCVHFEVGIREREPGVRLTLTNMEKEYVVTGNNTLKVPCHPPPVWTIICLDIPHHLQSYGLFSKGAIKDYTNSHVLKGIQLCANLSVRGIYTSDKLYTWQTLPRQMGFKLVKDNKWEEHYALIYAPATLKPTPTKEESVLIRQFPSNIVEREQFQTTRKHKSSILSPQNISKAKQLPQMPSQDYLTLQNAFSFSSLHNPDILFQGDDTIYYSAGSSVVARTLSTGQQTFLRGHTNFVAGLDSNGGMLVSVQQGAKSSVRVWIDNKCVCTFPNPYQKIQQVRVSCNGSLALLGLDSYKRQAIVLFNIKNIELQKQPQLIAKQTSDFNILTIKFAPGDDERLVSCGKENIRFWRVKSNHLPGTPVILNSHARNTVFTVLDFQLDYKNSNPTKQHCTATKVYVGSETGLLFQINYESKKIEEVYRLHEAAITSLVVSDGLCITGSADQYVRVWQTGFAQYNLQANNDGVVTSLALSSDALQVACGTSTGALFVLDLVTNNYRTIIRSHTEPVTQLVYHPYSHSILSLSNDFTIRLWDPVKLQQTYQFSYPPQDPCLCLCPNPNGLFFAGGFASGALRIFDIENTCVVQEIKHHQRSIIYLQYSLDGRFLAVMEQKLTMLYSPLHDHQPIKHLPVQNESKYKHCSFKEDSQTLAVIGDSGTHINLWRLKSLTVIGRLFAGKVIKKLKFQGERLWTVFDDTSVRRYNIQRMTMEVEMQAMHRNTLTAIAFELNNHLLFSAGGDSFVRVWDYSFLREAKQFAIGHVKDIHDLCYVDGQLWSAGSEGILVWAFHDNPDKFTPPPIFAKEKKATFISNKQNSQEQIQQLSNIEAVPQRKPKVMFSNLLKRPLESTTMVKFIPVRIEGVHPNTVLLKKYRKREGKPKLTLQLPLKNIELKLPLRHPSQQCCTRQQYAKKIINMKQFNKKYKLDYLLGLNGCVHDNIIWNFMYGWYAYTYDNLIIIEYLNKTRAQKIVALPQKLCSLALTQDFKKIIATTQFNSAAKGEQGEEEQSQLDQSLNGDKSTAAIFVVGLDFAIEKQFQFHPKGVQSVRVAEKLLVSIGNFRECTVCVWDLVSGKLKASSYTLDKLNDVAIAPVVRQGAVLQFATVGRDQIHLWAYTKDDKLEYRDIFIKEEQSIEQMTVCDYLLYHDALYLLAANQQGQLIIVDLSTQEVIFKKKICSGEVMSLKNYPNKTIVGSVDGSLYHWNHSASILQSTPTPSFTRINLVYSVIGMHFDTEGNEGVVATAEAIYYVNINDSLSSSLIGATQSPVIFMKAVLNYMLTSHENGRLKLWNVETGEELKTYKWKYPCTQAYYDEALGKVVCFCSNQTVKLVNLKKFTKEEVYLPEDCKPDREDDYVIATFPVAFGQLPARWVFTRRGCIQTFSIVSEGKKKVVTYQKILELNTNVGEIAFNPQKNIVVVAQGNGIVTTYTVDFTNKIALISIDKTTLDDFNVEKVDRMGDINAIKREFTVHVALSKVLNETYLAIAPDSQYVYYRNYMKRLTFQKISLGNWPTSVLLTESKKESEAIIGMRDGAFVRLNVMDCDQRLRFETPVNAPIEHLAKLKHSIVTAYPDAMALFSSEL